MRGETPFWNDVTVKTILRNEVYLGHMVQNKTGTVSYKNHKQVSKPESPSGFRVENTHEPLISQDVWDAVQRMDNHPARGRSGKSGTVSLFGGLLRCMDCGASMRYMRDYRKKGLRARSRSTRRMSATGTHRAAKTPVRPTTSTRRC